MDTNLEPIFDQNSRSQMPSSINDQPPFKEPSGFFGRKLIIVMLLGILVAVSTVGFFWFRNSRPADPRSENVTINIKGPERLASGNEAEYVITYNNGENADLLGLSMEVFYPSNFKFRSATPQAKTSSGQTFDLPVLRQGQQGEVVVRGTLTGKIAENKEIKARLHYKLSNFNSIFTVEQGFTTAIQAPDLLLEIVGPIDVNNGQDTSFTVTYSNVSQQNFDNVGIQLHYPAGFKYAASNPPASRNNDYWTVGNLPVGTQGKIDIKGSFTGDPNQEKIVVGELGMNLNNNFAPQVVASVAFKIVPSKLGITQKTNPSDYVSLGETVSYTLEYGNYGTIGMTNLVITLALEGAAIDFSQIKVSDAIVTGSTLTWKSGTLKNLALLSPNQEGSITFTLPLKTSLSTNLKNQIVKGSASIYSDQEKNPIKAADKELKVASKLGMLVSGKYVSGAVPMEVGKSTVYNITFMLTNLGNDLEDTELLASLPLPDSAWKNIIVPESERANVVFDKNANKIRWKVGKLPAFTGKFTPARTLTFQLEVIPSSADKNTTITLLRDIGATGRDTFIDKVIESAKIGDYRTADIDDPIMDDSNGVVK